MAGWIKLHRCFTEWEWYNDIPVRLVFLHFLLKANWEEKKWRGTNVKRGQLITGSIETPKEIGVTRQQFRRAIKVLKSTNEITTETTNKNTVVSIVKYEVYQEQENETTTKTTTNSTNKQPSKNHQRTTTKEVNNKRNKETKNIKERIAEFKNSLLKFKDDYDLNMLENFYNYWTEHGENDRKFRMEKQKSFDMSLRLKTWKKRDFENKNKNTQKGVAETAIEANHGARKILGL